MIGWLRNMEKTGVVTLHAQKKAIKFKINIIKQYINIVHLQY